MYDIHQNVTVNNVHPSTPPNQKPSPDYTLLGMLLILALVVVLVVAVIHDYKTKLSTNYGTLDLTPATRPIQP